MDATVIDGAAEHAPHRLGRKGEELAVRYLESQGLVVLSRNWRCRDGELDVVATDGRLLLVCEVKTRAGVGFGTPTEAVTADKAARIRRLARQWMAAHHCRGCEVRCDIVSIVWPPGEKPRLEHLKGAF
ncbi:putative endonuclease [Herbihabitans rhizosphaerae]|uniref:UPF0102 protein EV193_10821 n=1 Tax=Herbihabitans rhizosphaerae TaxID=1872711 RepID=A0A4Q7KHD0_9PSEU|nr:YraN family protein [Herbihabitans rhizosphaerae]RZS34673.1 putative endonuclease [Herbihabitans rhizosphaerae]